MEKFLKPLLLLILVLVSSLKVLAQPPERAPNSCMNLMDKGMLAPPERPNLPAQELFEVKKINEVIPLDLKPTDSGMVIFNRIADRSFQKIINSDTFKSTPLGAINEKVKEQTKIELSVKPQGDKVAHKLKAQVQPFQQSATLSYTGYIGVDYSLQPANDTQKIKVEEIIADKRIYYETTQGPLERLQQVGVRWDW